VVDHPSSAGGPRVLDTRSTSKALSGFLLSGFLFALLGPLLPAWGYHLGSGFVVVGNYFLSLGLGAMAAGLLWRRILRRTGLAYLFVLACSLACASLAYLASASPPVDPLWRMAGLWCLGFAAGLLNAALFCAISPAYREQAATTVVGGGVFHGIGCVAAAMVVSASFYEYSVRGILLLTAIIPAGFAVWYAFTRWPDPFVSQEPSLDRALRDFRSPPAVLFALLLFFQFGNEWTIAGWLPLYLIRRLGISPENSLVLTALYWLALLLGRLAVLLLLPVVRHAKLLLGGALAAQFGCIILTFTNNRFGAATGILFIGAGFATIYPLVAEKLGARFPYYHPGFFNGIFSFGLMGGLLAPATVGYLADALGMWVVAGLPFVGTAMVSLLIGAIWLEARISG
jgi:fucose permease